MLVVTKFCHTDNSLSQHKPTVPILANIFIMDNEIQHSVDGCSPDNYVALVDTQRIIVIIAHYVSDVCTRFCDLGWIDKILTYRFLFTGCFCDMYLRVVGVHEKVRGTQESHLVSISVDDGLCVAPTCGSL